MNRLVLRGARHPGDIAVAGDRIVAVGRVDKRPGDRVLRCDGDIVTAGLVNTHHHLFQWLTRGLAVDTGFFTWLRSLYPLWSRITADDLRAAARLGLARLALSGATTVADHHYLVLNGDDSVFHVLAETAREVGVRLHIARGMVDRGESAGGLAPDMMAEPVDAALASAEQLIDDLHDGDRVAVALAPASPLSASREMFRAAAELADHRAVRLHTHLAEDPAERERCRALHGLTPIELLEETGWLTASTWIAHAVHLDTDEIRRLGSHGVGVAHCPGSNSRLGDGICPVVDLVAAGVPVGLGVDGAASHEAGTLFPEMRLALYLARQRAGRPDALTTREALTLATLGGARCLGRDDLGRLEPGAAADIAVWPGDDLSDIADPVAALILGPERRVRHLLVAGEPVVSEGHLLTVDVRAAQADVAARARRLSR
ncbi:hydroxyatrazine ethylaminohydrolase [Streptosporangium violaceochromogenes]|nr:hydroxyatrazine ethylaminohydrolase [Streptosporangium violaceochromogenes]